MNPVNPVNPASGAPAFPRWFVELVKSVRSQGLDSLWMNLGAERQSEFLSFFEEMKRGWEEEKRKEWKAARASYQTAARKFPPYSDIAVLREELVIEEGVNRALEYYNRGVRAFKGKQFGSAIDHFLLALDVDPHMGNAQYNLALSYKLRYLADPVAFREGLYLAEEAFAKVLEKDPDNKKAQAQLASIDSLKPR